MMYTFNRTKKLKLTKSFVFLVSILYLMRLMCIQVTSLPVMERHRADDAYMTKHCSNRFDPTGGCNDFVFSGHTMLIVMSLLFTMYAQESFSPLLMLYGVGSSMIIIGSHSHYTVDVLLAWIISTLLFGVHFLYTDTKHFKTLLSS